MIDLSLCDDIAEAGQEAVSARAAELLKKWDGVTPWASAYLSYRLTEVGLSAADLASRAGFSRQYVYRVLRGEKPVSNEMVRAVVNATEGRVSAEELAFVAAMQIVEEVNRGSA